MESIFERNGTLANVSNSIDTPEGVSGRDTPVGRMALAFVTKGLSELLSDKGSKNPGDNNGGLFSKIKSFFSKGGDV